MEGTESDKENNDKNNNNLNTSDPRMSRDARRIVTMADGVHLFLAFRIPQMMSGVVLLLCFLSNHPWGLLGAHCLYMTFNMVSTLIAEKVSKEQVTNIFII